MTGSLQNPANDGKVFIWMSLDNYSEARELVQTNVAYAFPIDYAGSVSVIYSITLKSSRLSFSVEVLQVPHSQDVATVESVV